MAAINTKKSLGDFGVYFCVMLIILLNALVGL